MSKAVLQKLNTILIVCALSQSCGAVSTIDAITLEYPMALINIASYVGMGKSSNDYAMSPLSGKDCRVIYVDIDGQVCRPPHKKTSGQNKPAYPEMGGNVSIGPVGTVNTPSVITENINTYDYKTAHSSGVEEKLFYNI